MSAVSAYVEIRRQRDAQWTVLVGVVAVRIDPAPQAREGALHPLQDLGFLRVVVCQLVERPVVVVVAPGVQLPHDRQHQATSRIRPERKSGPPPEHELRPALIEHIRDRLLWLQHPQEVVRGLVEQQIELVAGLIDVRWMKRSSSFSTSPVGIDWSNSYNRNRTVFPV